MASASLSKMRIGAAITHLFFVCVLFSLLFHWGSFPRLDFWWSMTALNIALIVPAFLIDPSLHRRIFSDCRSFFFEKVIFGLASAAALYAVFFFGNMLAPLIIPG
ncbi:MAG TPA: hypothetical protein PLP17_05145, partial [Oligoflexia bacterium]|nr:hypothetical protein [Oligoflexia bacterium]